MIEIKEHVALAEHGTFRVGGPARFFAEATTLEDVKEALAFQQAASMPLFVLGGGSNMLFGDTGFDGLVLKIAMRGIVRDGNEVIAGAGVSWDELVAWTVTRDLGGLENLSGIPGTVGGAVVGNIGAYGKEVKDTLCWVEILDAGHVRRLSSRECQFSYRSSIFKTSVGRQYIVMRAAFTVGKQAKPAINYPDLLRHFSARESLPPTLTPAVVRKAILEIRAAKLPDVRRVGTAGSFFKNPIITNKHFADLKKRFPDMPNFPVAETGKTKVPAGWILDKVCGFKGKRWGTVGTYEQQALVLVNFGNATAADVAQAADEMTTAVKTATDITLEREVEYL